MKNLFLFCLISISAFFFSCSSSNSVITNKEYPPTDTVELYMDINSLPTKEYVEVGYVEANGAIFTDKETLLEKMIEEAKQHGADAIIKIEFFDKSYIDQNGTIILPNSKGMMIKYKSNIKQK